MKTPFIQFSLMLLLAAPMAAQVKADRPVGEFTGIKVSGPLDVKLTQGDVASVSLEAADQGEIDALKTEVNNGVLEIYAQKSKGNSVKVMVTVRTLKSVEVSGAGDVRTTGPIKSEELSVKCTGAGDLIMESETKKISVEASGAGDVVLSGSTDMLVANVSGAGDLKAFKLAAAKADIKSSGAGDARVNVKQSLHAAASGAGDVIYQEEPAEKVVEISGAGDVRKTHAKSTAGNGSDTTKLSVGHHKVLICEGDDEETVNNNKEHNFKHWSGLEVGIDGYRTGAKDGMTMPKGAEYMQQNYGKSISFAINLFEHDFHLYQNYLNLVTGLGFEFDHYALQNKVSLRYDSTYTTAKTDPSLSFKKNNLNESLLTVPLLLEFNSSTNPEKDFHIAVGVIGAWKIGAKTRQEYTDSDGKDVKLVKSNDYNLDPFRYSLTARIGYKSITLFANYGLSQLFKVNHGPELYAANAGVNVHF